MEKIDRKEVVRKREIRDETKGEFGIGCSKQNSKKSFLFGVSVSLASFSPDILLYSRFNYHNNI